MLGETEIDDIGVGKFQVAAFKDGIEGRRRAGAGRADGDFHAAQIGEALVMTVIDQILAHHQ